MLAISNMRGSRGPASRASPVTHQARKDWLRKPRLLKTGRRATRCFLHSLLEIEVERRAMKSTNLIVEVSDKSAGIRHFTVEHIIVPDMPYADRSRWSGVQVLHNQRETFLEDSDYSRGVKNSFAKIVLEEALSS